ncbi:SH3 domain-containing kinase-binding 1-like isoform X2 [Labeo rohita]|uniref:SH3 domain-containing kinase-binding protein 1 n=2 Tax=Labeo rohita TaxID=84645 RepID=A0ABQ8LK01_LABRO|nr:SH3 domain-containing kinase-binding protein 1 [Labeo rohita]XP_050948491.1 SH3 domain-containing kinase-binding protein 1 [Labeo rohita]XP_050948492.1 SH3 domain-containing kinase-binding protein 1 [Labeo rohita]KAI2650929.1 SH3 domain-containing kinase-binding protein 1 [Labeo rohita]RXN04763.1 SH3 domain-containing kinase-binding 1-like isoform X2 [Labeo rohita]
MGNYAFTADVEDFKSIVSTLESQRILAERSRLENTLSLNHAVEEQTGQEMNEVNQEPDLLALKFLYNNTDEPKDTAEAASSSSSGTTSVTPLPAYLSAALSASLAAKPRAAPQGPVTMEKMRAELRELRDELDTLKTQHKKEIKLLMNELDEEKKMRLSLQIDVERLKKHMSK